MAWDKMALLKARGIVYVIAGALIVVAYLISWLRGA
jgi:hypothetical protein